MQGTESIFSISVLSSYHLPIQHFQVNFTTKFLYAFFVFHLIAVPLTLLLRRHPKILTSDYEDSDSIWNIGNVLHTDMADRPRRVAIMVDGFDFKINVFIYFFIDDYDISDYIMSNCRIFNELAGIWKESVAA
jgi:hypothetical protein